MNQSEIEKILTILREITGGQERLRESRDGESYYSIKCPECGDKDTDCDNLNFYPDRPYLFVCYHRKNGKNCGHGKIILEKVLERLSENA